MQLLHGPRLPAAVLAAALLALVAACGTSSTSGGDDSGSTDGPTTRDVGAAVDLVGAVCQPGVSDGCESGRELRVCADDGSGWVVRSCVSDDGDGSCVGQGADSVCAVCVPAKRRCSESGGGVEECLPNGSAYTAVEDCDGAATGRTCVDGVCTRLCELSIKFNSYMGCEYWPVDLDNGLFYWGDGRYNDAAHAPYAVVVSNPHPEWPATVELSIIDDDSGEEVPLTLGRGGDPLDLSPIPAGELRVLYLDGKDVNGTTQAPLAYRLRSSIPITAYQFNPLENVEVYSNDASLLLPTNALGRHYIVMSREEGGGENRSFMTVVATTPGTTRVSVTPSARTLVGEAAGIAAHEPGESFTRELQQFDVLNIETNRVGDDLTGSVILADRPVAVFGGNECGNVPNTTHCVDNPTYDPGVPESPERVCEYGTDVPCREHDDCELMVTCCCDHLEQQMLPVKTWGARYLAVRIAPRGDEPDSWRVIAAEDGTRVTTMPPQESIPVLDRGEWFEFESHNDFELHATGPVMLGQYMHGEHAPVPGMQAGDAGTGDPAFCLSVPMEQFRPDYVFLAPNKYAFDFVNVIAPVAASVELDGETIAEDEFHPFGTGEFKCARLPVEDGVHRLFADEPVAVMVYGYDQYVSYAYPGGLDLTELRDDPEGVF